MHTKALLKQKNPENRK